MKFDKKSINFKKRIDKNKEWEYNAYMDEIKSFFSDNEIIVQFQNLITDVFGSTIGNLFAVLVALCIAICIAKMIKGLIGG